MTVTDEYTNRILSKAQQLLWSGSLHEVDEAHNLIAGLLRERITPNGVKS